MAGLVLDSSCTVALLLPDEQAPSLVALKAEIARDGAIVPHNWRLEVANALLMAHRRKRISSYGLRESLRDFEIVPVEIDVAGLDHVWADTLDLAQTHGLTLYDAAYLELSIRLALPLASLDNALITAAKAERLPLFTTA